MIMMLMNTLDFTLFRRKTFRNIKCSFQVLRHTIWRVIKLFPLEIRCYSGYFVKNFSLVIIPRIQKQLEILPLVDVTTCLLEKIILTTNWQQQEKPKWILVSFTRQRPLERLHTWESHKLHMHNFLVKYPNTYPFLKHQLNPKITNMSLIKEM